VDHASFLKAVERGQVPPVALLHGPEPFLLEDTVALVTRALFPDPVELDLQRETLDAKEVGADAIVGAALLLPWTGSRRLVVVKGADGIAARQAEPLAAYIRSPNPSTVLLLVAPQLLGPSHWLMNAVPGPQIVPVPPPAAGQLVGWLRGRARSEGFELAEDAAQLLVELSGSDLTQLRGELDKAALAGGPDNRRIGIAEVRAVVGEHRLRHIFDLTRALTARDRSTALSVLEMLLSSGEDPFGLLGMLGREVRAMWQAADGLRRGRREDEIARSLGRPPGAAAAMIDRARAMAPEAGARLLARCWEAERRLKLSGPGRAELSLLIADLCES